MKIYEQHCSVYLCGNLYRATSNHTPCPKCGISEYDIMDAGTNDRKSIYQMWNKRSIDNTKEKE